MSRKRLLCTVLAAALIASMVGCTTTTTAPTTSTAKASTAATTAATTTPAATTTAALTATKLPIVDKPLTLTYFIELDAARVGVSHASYSELICFQDLEKVTGVKIDFLHPPTGQAAAQLNLLISSNTLPDIAYYNWRAYPGGPDKLITDNVILKLNDSISKLSPNLTKIFADNPSVKKDSMTDLGNFYIYPIIQIDPLLTNNFGYLVRTDWLTAVNKKAPETMDEWYDVLTAFRNNDPNGNGKKDELPIISRFDVTGDGATVMDFYMAWGKFWDFYVKNNAALYGPYEPEYKDFLKTMAKWYKEGLIDPDFATTDQTQYDAKMLNNLAGVSRSGLGATATILKNIKNDNGVVGVANPVLKKGDKPWNVESVSRPVNGSGAAISTKSKNAEVAAKWLDYCFSKDGYMLLNYGRLGEQYTMVSGYPTLVDSIMKNPKLSVNVALGQFAIGVTSFSFWNDGPVREQRQFSMAVQKTAAATWSTQDISGIWPNTTPTPAESTRLASVMNEVKTFVNERTLAFIMGKADIDADFSKYIQTLKDLGIEDAIKINNDALARYYKR